MPLARLSGIIAHDLNALVPVPRQHEPAQALLHPETRSAEEEGAPHRGPGVGGDGPATLFQAGSTKRAEWASEWTSLCDTRCVISRRARSGRTCVNSILWVLDRTKRSDLAVAAAVSSRFGRHAVTAPSPFPSFLKPFVCVFTRLGPASLSWEWRWACRRPC